MTHNRPHPCQCDEPFPSWYPYDPLTGVECDNCGGWIVGTKPGERVMEIISEIIDKK